MEQAKFETMVAALERVSERTPGLYRFKVVMLTIAGFGLIGLMMGFAGLGLLMPLGVVAAIVVTGGKAWIVLLKLGKLLLLLAIPCWLLLKASASALFARIPAPRGIELSRRDAPALFAQTDQLRRRMKGPTLHHVLITDELNAAALQRPVLGIFGFQRNYLILGLPLLESLSRDEAMAVIAHEYGHLAGAHGSFGAFIYRLRNSWGTIQSLSEQWTGWFGRRLQSVVAWYAPYFNAYTFVLARANEYEADAASADMVGPAAAVSALKRVNLAAGCYDDFLKSSYDGAMTSPTPPADLHQRWAARAPFAVGEQDAAQWLQRALRHRPHYADTHPSLEQRLAALSGQSDQTTTDSIVADRLPPALDGHSAAQLLLGDHVNAIRETLQSQWTNRVREPWHQRYTEVQARRERLAALRAQPTTSVAEQIESLQLSVQLEPDGDHLPAVTQFNLDQPDQAVALFLEADIRLAGGDDHGLALLERVMSLDPQATRVACERAYAHLAGTQDPRAQQYLDRASARSIWEAQRASEIENLDVRQQLVSAELPQASRDMLTEMLRRQGKGVARAWVARRLIAADPQYVTCLLGIELTRWARWRGHHHAVIRRMVLNDFPTPLYVCILDKNLKGFAPQFAGLPGARLVFRGD